MTEGLISSITDNMNLTMFARKGQAGTRNMDKLEKEMKEQMFEEGGHVLKQRKKAQFWGLTKKVLDEGLKLLA